MTDANQVRLGALQRERRLTPAERRQRRLAPAKSALASSDPRRLFADSTVRSRVLELFRTVPALREAEAARKAAGAGSIVGGHLRRPVTRYVLMDLIWWRMAAQFVTEGDLNAALGDRLRQWATKLEAAERALGMTETPRELRDPLAALTGGEA